MAQPNPRIKVSTQGSVTIAELVDKKILDEISIAEISRQLERLVTGADKPLIALDFASVAHMSSSMLGKLITLNKHVREQVKRDVLKHGSDGNLRIQHYFSGSDKIYLRLHKDLVKSAGRNGRR